MRPKKILSEFEVKCYRCDNIIKVKENEHEHPVKDKYYCSRSCANKRDHSEETKHKISKSVSVSMKEQIKNGRKNKFILNNESRKKASESLKRRFLNPDFKKKHVENSLLKRNSDGLTWHQTEKGKKIQSERARKIIEEGRHKGFPIRFKNVISFPEQYFKDRLDELDIKYEREVKINRYWGDFVFKDKRIVLEIDGSQHKRRIKSDERKDFFLTRECWLVYRIEWKKDFPLMRKEFEKFIQIHF